MFWNRILMGTEQWYRLISKARLVQGKSFEKSFDLPGLKVTVKVRQRHKSELT